MQQYFGKNKKENTIFLNSEDLNHIKNVMRMKENDEVIVAYENKSYICALNKDLLSASIKRVFKENTLSMPASLYSSLQIKFCAAGIK